MSVSSPSFATVSEMVVTVVVFVVIEAIVVISGVMWHICSRILPLIGHKLEQGGGEELGTISIDVA